MSSNHGTFLLFVFLAACNSTTGAAALAAKTPLDADQIDATVVPWGACLGQATDSNPSYGCEEWSGPASAKQAFKANCQSGQGMTYVDKCPPNTKPGCCETTTSGGKKNTCYYNCGSSCDFVKPSCDAVGGTFTIR